MGGVDVVPADAVAFLIEEALRVTSRDDLDVMPGDDKASRQQSGVILHSSDAVARDGDDANPHRPSMLCGGAGPDRVAVLGSGPLRQAVTVSCMDNVASHPRADALVEVDDVLESLARRAGAQMLTFIDGLVDGRPCRT
jgi:hypothetical protein